MDLTLFSPLFGFLSLSSKEQPDQTEAPFFPSCSIRQQFECYDDDVADNSTIGETPQVVEYFPLQTNLFSNQPYRPLLYQKIDLGMFNCSSACCTNVLTLVIFVLIFILFRRKFMYWENKGIATESWTSRFLWSSDYDKVDKFGQVFG